MPLTEDSPETFQAHMMTWDEQKMMWYKMQVEAAARETRLVDSWALSQHYDKKVAALNAEKNTKLVASVSCAGRWPYFGSRLFTRARLGTNEAMISLKKST